MVSPTFLNLMLIKHTKRIQNGIQKARDISNRQAGGIVANIGLPSCRAVFPLCKSEFTKILR
jgi:hypothetical protein